MTVVEPTADPVMVNVKVASPLVSRVVGFAELGVIETTGGLADWDV